MSTRMPLLPPVNRNLSTVCDHNKLGLVAYGSRSNIYVFDFRVSPPVVLDNKVIRNSHRGNVFSVSFCKLKDNDFLASVGEDAVLRIWDLETLSSIASIEVKEITRIVEWLYESSYSVVYPDSNGAIIKWNFRSHKTVKIKSGSEAIASAIASNALSPEIMAVGHCSGSISIMNVVSHNLLHTLRVHQMVASLSWSPLFPDVLLSTCDKSARVWKLGNEKPEKTYYFPTSRKKEDDKKLSVVCATFHPENPDIIICSNIRGNVGLVTFKDEAIPKFSPFSDKEAEMPFKSVIKILPYHFDVDGKTKLSILTFDHVRVSLWDISEEKLERFYYHYSGCLFDLACSTINPNLMAICSGDGIFKVWNMSSTKMNLDITTIYTQFRGKIMCAAWHPTEENIVAYATDEGKVGIIDIFKKKPLYSFESHHPKAVYGLQWGPCSKANESKDSNENLKEFYLYSCGGGIILVHELDKPKEKALAFENLVELPPDLEKFENSISEVAWKSDYTCIAVGNYKGFIDIFNSELVFLSRFSIQMKAIESMKWHPICTYASPSGSAFNTWIAVAGNDDNIHILDTNDAGTKSSICTSSKTLAGHKKKISSVSWSQHVDGHLASASKDGTVQVWNVATGALIVNYAEHKDILNAVQWSVIDSDVIFSGGKDFCLRMWNISDQKESAPPQKTLLTKYRKPLRRIREKKNISESAVNENGTLEASGTDERKEDKLEDNSKEAPDVSAPVSVSEKHFKNKFNEGFPVKKMANLFPNLSTRDYSKEEYFQNIFKLTDILAHNSETQELEDSVPVISAKMEDDDIDALGIFVDQISALKMIENRAKYNWNNDRKEHASYLGIMAHNIEPLLRDLAEAGQLSDFHVAAAPSVSYKFWVEMAEKYAVQLVEDHQYLKASMYFILCGKLYDAVKMLAEKGRIIDALALARARLPEDDPIISSLFYKNARNFSILKCMEAEVLCYLAAKQPSQAAKLLYCASDSKYIWAAAYVCKKFNLKEEMETYALLCTEKCLSQNDWPTFYEMAKEIESVKVYMALIRVHELLQNNIKLLKKEDINANDIFGNKEIEVLIWSGKMCADSNTAFLVNAFKILQKEEILPLDKNYLQCIHEALISFEDRRKKSETAEETHIYIAIYTTQLLVLLAMARFDHAVKYFNKIFDVSYNVVFLPKIITWIFLPIDLYWSGISENFMGSVQNIDSEESQLLGNMNAIYTSLCKKFSSIKMDRMQVNSLSVNISTDLNAAVKTVAEILSKKEMSDSILLFFLVSYINELKRVAKKGWKFRCYVNVDHNGSADLLHPVNNSQNILKIENSHQGPEGPNENENKDNGAMTNNEMNRAIHSEETSITASKDENSQCKINDNESVNELAGGVSLNSVHLNTENLSEFKKSHCEDKTDLTNNISDNCAVKSKCASNSENVSLDNINNNENYCEKVNNEEMSSSIEVLEENFENESLSFCDKNNDHDVCWKDMNLFYALTKSFASELCRDEYALINYLEWTLKNIEVSILNSTQVYLRFQAEKSKAIKTAEASIETKSSEQSEVDIKDAASQSQKDEENAALQTKSSEQSEIDIKDINAASQSQKDEENAALQTKSSEQSEIDIKDAASQSQKDEENAALQAKSSEQSEIDIKDINAASQSQIDKENAALQNQNDDVALKSQIDEDVTAAKHEDKNQLKADDVVVKDSNYNKLSNGETSEESSHKTEIESTSGININNLDGSSINIDNDNECKSNFSEFTKQETSAPVNNEKSVPSSCNEAILQSAEKLNLTQSVPDNNGVKTIDESTKISDFANVITVCIEKATVNEIDGEFKSLTRDELNALEDAQKDLPIQEVGRKNSIEEKFKEMNAEHERISKHLMILKSQLKFQLNRTVVKQKDSTPSSKEELQSLLSSNVLQKPPDITEPSTVHLLLDAEDETKEFSYPNPFQAALDIIEICCEIFRKTPCTAVKERFHSLAHEILQWCSKYPKMEYTLSMCHLCSACFSA